MFRQDKKCSKDVLKEYIERQIDMMNETKTIIAELVKNNGHFKESIYQTTQAFNEFEHNTITLNGRVDETEEIV